MSDGAAGMSQAEVKQCCAAFYGSDYARFLLGDSFHPGGTKLTHELGEWLALGPHSTVLDVASGRGTSALYLAETFGCKVVGLDLSEENVRLSQESANLRGLEELVRCEVGDAESLALRTVAFRPSSANVPSAPFLTRQRRQASFFAFSNPMGKSA